MRPLEPANVPTQPLANQQLSTQKGHSVHGLATSRQSKRDLARTLHRHLRKAAQHGKYELAIRILDHLIRLTPNRSEYYNNRGLMYYSCRQWRRAMANYDHALTLSPHDDRIYNNRANCQAAQGNWSNAIADYEQSIDINPFNIQARINQGIAFRDMGQYDEALNCFDIALFFRPALSIIFAERGRTYALQGHWNCAMGDYQRALNVSTHPSDLPTSPSYPIKNRVYQWIGELLMVQGHHQ